MHRSNQWKGTFSNNTISVLKEATWVKRGDFNPYEQEAASTKEVECSSLRLLDKNISSKFVPTMMTPFELFRVNSGLHEVAGRVSEDLGDDALDLEDVEESKSVAVPSRPTDDLLKLSASR